MDDFKGHSVAFYDCVGEVVEAYSSLSMSWRHSRKGVSALTTWKVMLPIGELMVIDLIDDVWPMLKQA